MKKTNLLLFVILLINAVILWKVWCGSSSCTKSEKCSYNVECTKGDHSECKHSTKKECCSSGNKKECSHGAKSECTHGSAHYGHGGHGDHGYVCHIGDSNCTAADCMIYMMMHMPEDHKAETVTWLKDELGLSDDQIATITTAVSELSTKREAVHADMKLAMTAQNDVIKAMLNEEQMKKVEEMMTSHHGHSKVCKHHAKKSEDTPTEDAN